MKVVRHGRNPADAIYFGHCNHCGAQMEAARSELTLVSDQRDGDYYTAKCPECGTTTNFTPKRSDFSGAQADWAGAWQDR